MEIADWVERVFGQADPSGATDAERLDGICGPDQTTLLRLIDVFESAAAFLGKYPDAVLGQAFWDVSEYAFPVIHERRIEPDLRVRLVRSFETVFREIFAVRCAPVLGHCADAARPLNTACFMWWDFNCWLTVTRVAREHPRDPRLDAAALETIEAVLKIDHIACQESALHGLGHWHAIHPLTVERIIDGFLERQLQLPEPLRAYALKARDGSVL